MLLGRSSRTLLVAVLLLSSLICHPTHIHAESMNELIKTVQPENSQQMVQQSDLIVYAHLNQSIKRWNTGKRLPSGAHFVNAEQLLQIHEVLKGSVQEPVKLLTTGIDPLPQPSDPLNNLYTGPLADGDYLLFLKSYSQTQHYILNGGFAAVYPVYAGKLIALNEGFKTFNGKTIAEVRPMLH
ncbi:hypothetical protein SIN01_04250 [Sporolactobacillus inulinus]|nr:hypothetical protein SIN01_04250 [Sporolactobacillus inulinus]